MKTIITLVIASTLSFSAMAGNGDDHRDKYCVKMRDGKRVVMYQGGTLASEVTLKNGYKITIDGTVVKTNGTRYVMSEGECIDRDGVIANERKDEEKNKPK